MQHGLVFNMPKNEDVIPSVKNDASATPAQQNQQPNSSSAETTDKSIRPNSPVQMVCHNEVRGNVSIRTFITDLPSNKK